MRPAAAQAAAGEPGGPGGEGGPARDRQEVGGEVPHGLPDLALPRFALAARHPSHYT